MPDPEVSNKEDARLWIGSPGFEDQPPCGKNTYAPEVTDSEVKCLHSETLTFRAEGRVTTHIKGLP